MKEVNHLASFGDLLDAFHIKPLPDLPLTITVMPGQRGEDVRLLQKALRSAGYLTSLNGRFDQVTENCVRSFQATHGIKRDGIAGPATWAALGGAAYA